METCAFRFTGKAVARQVSGSSIKLLAKTSLSGEAFPNDHRIKRAVRKIMGCSQSWLAVKGNSPESVLKLLGLRFASAEQSRRSKLQGVQLTNGWYVVLSGTFGLPALSNDAARLLSQDCELVRGSVEDNEMVSAAEGWNNGRKLWSVVHDPIKGENHLEAEGDVPNAYGAIRDRLQTAQETESDPVDHIFDIPVELAKHLTGYHPEENIPGARFEPLAEMSWFAKVFKR